MPKLSVKLSKYRRHTTRNDPFVVFKANLYCDSLARVSPSF